MATIYIDNQPHVADSARNLLQVALSMGYDLPYFCWHPALGSVGACRQCAVKQFKDENDTQGKIVMACMVPAADGTRISIEDTEAREFRKSVIEWLMINHPHDCPVCDEGGECHLQDMTVMCGHAYRRFRFKKRTFRNQDLGPFINHEMNRCITCYRCVRFYKDYAGGTDLDAFAAHNHVYFGRHEDGVLENEFSGNLVEVCPTGVFTDKTLKQHYSRKWDLTTAPSICTHCGLGCNIIPGQRYGQLRRVLNRYNGEVNGYFICDRGRFGYDFVNSPRRVREPLVKAAGFDLPDKPQRTLPLPAGEGRGEGGSAAQVLEGFEPVSKDQILQHLAPLLRDRDRLIGIGSPRASLEANFALRMLVGTERFFSGMSGGDNFLTATILQIMRNGPARSPSLKDIEQADAVLILGEDLTNTAPRMALAVRQAVRNQPMRRADSLKIPRWHDKAVRDALQQDRGPLHIATPASTRLDDVATNVVRAAPDDISRLGFAVARAISGDEPDVPNLPGETRSLASSIAEALKAAERPVVIAGTSLRSEAVIQSAANIAWALCRKEKECGLSFVAPEANTIGLAMLEGRPLSDALNARDKTVIIVENDLYRRAPSKAVDEFFQNSSHVVVLDHVLTRTAQRADAVLPSGTFAESDGTFVNNEGRAQRFFQVFPPQENVQESWRWLRDLMLAAGATNDWHNLDDVISALASEVPALRGVKDAAPSASFRLAGQKFLRAPRRFSGRTAITAGNSVHEAKPPEDPDSPLSFTMEGYSGVPPAPLISHFWSPGWNSVQSVNKFQSEVGGPLRGGDAGARLIGPATGAAPEFFANIPPAFSAKEGRFLAVTVHHIFGSEELSMMSPAIAGRAMKPCVMLGKEDAVQLELLDGAEAAVIADGAGQRLEVAICHELPRGVVGVPDGLPAMPWLDFPAWVEIRNPA